MRKVWSNLKTLRPDFRKLNKEEFQHITQKIENCQCTLKAIQEQMKRDSSAELLAKEREILLDLEKWDLIEENIMKQNARVDGIKLGDSNTKYFLSVFKEKTQKKQIIELTSLTDVKLEDSEDIKEEIRLFCKGLMGSSANLLPAVNRQLMKRGPRLTHAQQLLLCKEVTSQEIEEGLQAIGSDKVPGVDGYNAAFFKKPGLLSSKMLWLLYRNSS